MTIAKLLSIVSSEQKAPEAVQCPIYHSRKGANYPISAQKIQNKWQNICLSASSCLLK